MPGRQHSTSRIDERLGDVERRLREVRRSMKAAERGRLPPSRNGAPAAAPSAAADVPAPPSFRSEEGASGVAGRGASEDHSRFQRYFAHASFPAGAVGRRDRRVLRNKAIAVALGALFLAMLIYLWFS